jgi:hypothetical protein
VEKQTEKTEKKRKLRKKKGNGEKMAMSMKEAYKKNMKKIYNGKSRENGRKGME